MVLTQTLSQELFTKFKVEFLPDNDTLKRSIKTDPDICLSQVRKSLISDKPKCK